MKMVARKTRTPAVRGRRTQRLGGGSRSVSMRQSRRLRPRGNSERRKRAQAVRPVRFEYFAPGASLVFLAGNFNEWNAHAHPLRKLRDGRWALSLRLKPGRYEYRFLVDGIWRPDPRARQYVTDFCGGLNSVTFVE